MNKLLRGIEAHQVVCIRGRENNIQGILRDKVCPVHPCLFFSGLDADLTRLRAALASRQWDGTRPVVVCVRCDMVQVAPLIKKRQRGQAVIIVADGEYSPATTRLADVTIKIGKVPVDMFGTLRTGSTAAIVAELGLDRALDQLGAAAKAGLGAAGDLSDLDLLSRRIPDEMVEACLPPNRGAVRYTAPDRKAAGNHRLLQIAQPLVAKATGSLLGSWATREYIDFAHRIEVAPEIAQFPRDDPEDPRFVQNVNDRLRVLVGSLSAPPAAKRRRGSVDAPSPAPKRPKRPTGPV